MLKIRKINGWLAMNCGGGGGMQHTAATMAEK